MGDALKISVNLLKAAGRFIMSGPILLRAAKPFDILTPTVYGRDLLNITTRRWSTFAPRIGTLHG